MGHNAALQTVMDTACEAAIQGDLSALKLAVAAACQLDGYTINSVGSRCRTPLYQACLGRQPEAVRWLLEQGADDFDGGAYICICAAGRGDENHPDPGERTAAIMRLHGFPRKKKKKVSLAPPPVCEICVVTERLLVRPWQKKKQPAENEPKRKAKGKGGIKIKKKGSAAKQSPADLLQAALAAASTDEQARMQVSLRRWGGLWRSQRVQPGAMRFCELEVQLYKPANLTDSVPAAEGPGQAWRAADPLRGEDQQRRSRQATAFGGNRRAGRCAPW